MQAELVALQPQLVKTVAEVEALMERIAHDKKHEVRLEMIAAAFHVPVKSLGTRGGATVWAPFAIATCSAGTQLHNLVNPTPAQVELKAAVVREDEAHARTTADAAKAIKDECEADLAEVRPNVLDPSDLH